MTNHRIAIYAKDIERITGKCPRTAYSILQKIKKKNNKSKEQIVTITELCEYLGITESLITQLL